MSKVLQRVRSVTRFELVGAIRRLARTPGFTSLVVCLLAPALAATLAVASAAYGLLLRPLPYPGGDRLVEVRGFMESIGFGVGLSVPLALELPNAEGVLAAGYWLELGTREGDVRAVRANPGLFDTLGVTPLMGRAIAAEDDASVAVISESLWRTQFASSPDVLGQSVVWRGEPRRIVGVMPAAFRFPDAKVDLWTPLLWTAAERSMDRVGSFEGLGVVARLRQGLTPETFQSMFRSHMQKDERIGPLIPMMKLRFDARSLRDIRGESARPAVRQLATAMAIVLLITGANLANLWLLRTVQRRRELAIASALGASRARAAAGITMEIAVATTVATLLGLSAAPLLAHALSVLGLVDDSSLLFVGIDGFGIVFAAATAVALTAMLALVPWFASASASADALQRAGIGAERPRQVRMRQALVALQIAAAVALLGASGLLLRSLRTLESLDTGFARENVLVANVGWTAGRDTDSAKLAPDMQQLFARAQADSRFGHVSFSTTPPFAQSIATNTIRVAGTEGPTEVPTRLNVVSPNYFSTLGIRTIAGRMFAQGGRDEAVVDEVFARRFFGGPERALGRQFDFAVAPGPDGAPVRRPTTIIGVVRTVKHMSLDEKPDEPLIYRAADAPDGNSSFHILARSALPASEMHDLLRAEAKALGLTVRVDQLDAMVRETLAPRRSIFTLLSGFALFGVLLAMVGLYAVLAYSARLRIPELGLRRALGAGAASLARRMLREAASMLIPGLVLGAFAAFAVAQAIRSQLFGIEAYDPVTWAMVCATVLALALAASAGPALRAARIEPTDALRHD